MSVDQIIEAQAAEAHIVIRLLAACCYSRVERAFDAILDDAPPLVVMAYCEERKRLNRSAGQIRRWRGK